MNTTTFDKTREHALALLHEYTESPHLIKHALAVEAGMRFYAQHYKQDPVETEKWAICGLVHDFDYEAHPDPTPPDGHPFFGTRLLGELGYGGEIVEAVLGHANYSGVARQSLMAKTLFAVDEMSGFITACTLVRPDKSLSALEVKSVVKRMKDKAFARGCNREDMLVGAEELGIALDEHVRNMIEALKPVAEQLGVNS
jgi:predicted hydrolase (HD superfamily)